MAGPTAEEVEALYLRLCEEAEAAGYHLNPDRDFTLMLVEGLLRNKERYGYMLCPCRVGEGDREKDRDIICPCDYRDADLDEYGQCY
jgi:ferredoxin-thioredoxin reductase catalytic subunit